jgi:quercetin dioxygenase-like cupin family protein
VKHFFDVANVDQQRSDAAKLYQEFLRVPSMSAGLYVLPAGAPDPQRPHNEGELYYVIRGRARMTVGQEEQEVRTGSMIFVEAGVEHRFYDIEEDLQVLVFFAPAET